jgi:hypothetical protein
MEDLNLDHATLLARAMEELGLKTQVHDETWGLGKADWEVDQELGRIAFFAPNKTVAVCPVQIIGTYNSLDGSWLWGWDHPSVEPALQQHAKLVRDYGLKHRIADFTTQKMFCTEEKAWEFTAIACKLGGAQGAYRGPAGTTFIFMTFGTIQLQMG